ncbi:hypothetical protein SAMN04488034_10655 [Salinimicrobium catena]|uniref:TonB protein C-terminal n=1 Tax=Salinimicrobium catena TaxID=390640 RepID=A0A1H5NY11_9FLAO|nr:hypothetical protein [Salinimicrobium catena]SDL60050.1 hypothetical protein SAMN04488140_10659 [Salinimicrobium catena]SEF05608.1 hypothetical protein SAMN04488034_10655 [Salinimicrobium catena]
MKNLKTLFVIFAIVLSTTAFAKAEKFTDPASVTEEIEKLVKSETYVSEGALEVTIFFSISEEDRIQSLSVASSNEEINQVLLKELNGKELTGEQWLKGKVYELTVTVR